MEGRRYLWRRLTLEDRKKLLRCRREADKPWHSPPRFSSYPGNEFHLTAACFEHVPIIGATPDRMDSFSNELLTVLESYATQNFAWCVLPNHYHVLVETSDLKELVRQMGKLHGRNSYVWNGEENCRGRQVFFRAADREIRSEGHFFATLNYVHHNPVHHGYADNWTEWPWSSAREYLETIGKQEAERIWKAYPVLDYGKGWDDPDM